MKKILSLILALSFLLLTCIPAYATEGEPNDQTDIGSDMVELSDPLDSSTTGTTDGGENTSTPGTGYNEEGLPVVDVSEQSVQAIAAAVNLSTNYTYQYTFTLNNGKTISFDTDIPDLVEDYHIVITNNGDINIVKNGNIYVDSSMGSYFKNNGTRYCLSGNSIVDRRIFSFESLTSSVQMTDVFGESWTSAGSFKTGTLGGDSVVLYSNRNILYDNGEVYFLSESASYLISFQTGFEDLSIPPQQSKTFVLPDPPIYSGYTFDGWYLDVDFSVKYTSGYVFSENTTLYAKWIKFPTISFVTNIDGFELESLQVSPGPYTVPNFHYDGYSFVGAYLDSGFETPFIDGTELSDDITLYLRFDEVTFDLEGLITKQVQLTEGLQIIQSQLWIILVVGLMYYVYKLFRLFF